MKVLSIESPYFSAGVCIDDQKGVVVTAAPIIRYMIDWQEKKVRRYCENRGWEITEVGSYT